MRQSLLFGIAWACLFAGCINADDRVFAEKQSKKAEETAKALRIKIQDEIKTLGNHAWAGEYYHGDGMGVNVTLVLAPKSGYVFEWHGCLGLYDRNYGTVTENNGRLHLSFTFANEQEGFQGIAEEFIPIAWGDRKYLIPSDDVIGFCNDVNDGTEPRKSVHGMYLLRDGDEKREVTGSPEVPEKFKSCLLAGSVEADIIEVGISKTRPSVSDWSFRDTPITLNCGRDKGLVVGMKLHVVKPEHIVVSANITKVNDERSEAVITQVGDEEAAPQVGWKLSTRCPWHPIQPNRESASKGVKQP